MKVEYYLLAFLKIVGAACSLDPSLNAYSASAKKAHPNHSSLTGTGKRVEKDITKDLQPRPNQISYTERDVPRLRFFKLQSKAQDAEHLRNYWHKEKDRLGEKLQKSNRRTDTKLGKALAILPDTMEGKHRYAKRKSDGHKKVLKDIAKDAAVHKNLGHINSEDEREINKIKYKDSIDLGYTSAGSPTGPTADT